MRSLFLIFESASLLSALTGRFWAGKDAVLKATVALAKLSPKKMLPKIPQLIERFMRECGREKESVVYSRESVSKYKAKESEHRVMEAL
jgi:hypothetical protein